MGVLNSISKFFQGMFGGKSDSMDLKDYKIDESTKTQRDSDRAAYAARHRDHRGSSSNYRGNNPNRNYRAGGEGRAQQGGQGYSRDSQDRSRNYRDRGNNQYRGDRPSSSAPSQDRGGDRSRGDSRGGEHRGGPRRGNNNWRDRGGNNRRGPSEGGNRYSQRPSSSSSSSLPKEERKFLVGTVTQFLDSMSVAAVKVQKGAIQVNDLLAFEGQETKFRQKITSLQIDSKPVTLARVGEEVGMQVQELVRPGDQVFRVEMVSSSR